MHTCKHCNKELKSKGGLTRHLNNCKAKVETPDKEPIIAKICSNESDYYAGHPRRKIKLEGLLSRTFDPKERLHISNIIVEL